MRIAFYLPAGGVWHKGRACAMHTWLPDAHSESPAPLSATMSGVLLAVALYAILRWKVVVTQAWVQVTPITCCWGWVFCR